LQNNTSRQLIDTIRYDTIVLRCVGLID